MRLGFTGTREGATERQLATLTDLLASMYHPREHVFLHGSAIGADDQAARIAFQLCWTVVALPSNVESMRAHTERHIMCEVRPPKPPLERNRDIVAGCDLLIAAPRTLQEELRSGTWSCI